jgi:hypothetical protein
VPTADYEHRVLADAEHEHEHEPHEADRELNTEHVEYVGVVHVHTGHSDGHGSVREVVAAAGQIGLDFAVIADHDSLAAREAGDEGWHGRVLVAAGAEISTKKNLTHLLTLGHAWTAPRFEFTVDEVLEKTRADGGAALLAHAQGRGLGGRGRDRRDWPWWDHPLLAGAEIWSYLQDWGASFRLLSPASYRLENVPGRIQGPPGWLLAYWDQQAEKRPFAGIGANDNHAKRLWPFRKRYWPHEKVLGRLVNRVRLPEPLPEDGAEAARRLMAALGAGHCVFAREELASSRGFDFFARLPVVGCWLSETSEPTDNRQQTTDNQVFRGGESVPFAPGIKLLVESPQEAELRICRLGRAVASATGRRLEFEPAEPGAYRAEARLPWLSVPGCLLPDQPHRQPTTDHRQPALAWCFSNHVRLTG